MKKLVSLLTIAALLFSGMVFAQNEAKKEEKNEEVKIQPVLVQFITEVKDKAEE